MAQLLAFGAQVRTGSGAGRRAAGNSLRHAYARLFELLYFLWVIRQQPYCADAQRFQRFGRELVIARVGFKSQLMVRFNRVQPGILQLIRSNLVDQADTAAFLRQIQNDACGFFRDFSKRKFKLSMAVASLRLENISRQTLGVYAHERHLRFRGYALAGEVAMNNRDRFMVRV